MVRRTSSLGFFTGRRRRRIWSRRVNIAVLAPMPRPRVRIAMAVKPGVRPRVRREYLRSRQMDSSDSISALFSVASLISRLRDCFWDARGQTMSLAIGEYVRKLKRFGEAEEK